MDTMSPSSSTGWALLLLYVLLPPAIAEAREITFLPFGASWRYLDDGSDQGSAWKEPGFDDSGWAIGAAELGYGDGDEATVVSFGPDPANRHITTYFRHTFQLTQAASYLWLRLRLIRDDGAVVYLNGTEVARTIMPDGPITSSTQADSVIGGDHEDVALPIELDSATLLDGDNVIAVEVHQRSPTSTDISFDLELMGGTEYRGLIRGPYLQKTSDTAVTICWLTDELLDGRVSFGIDPTALTQSVSAPTPAFQHCLRPAGLEPGTLYFYTVGSSAGELAGVEENLSFRTAPARGSAGPTRIWVLGDSGTGGAGAQDVRDAYLDFTGNRRTDLVLMLGDNAYNDGTDPEHQIAVFETYEVFLRQTPLWPTLGNHDGHSADSGTQSGPYYEIFDLPAQAEAGGLPSGTEAYYSFDVANIHIVCLDSYDSNRDPAGPMLTWLAKDLAASNADWNIAFFHHPPYSKGSHDSDTDTRMTQMRENALPALEELGIDLVLAGHSHAYERSHLIHGHYGDSATLLPQMILDSGDGNPVGDGFYQKPRPGPAPNLGTVYAVMGASARVAGGDLDHPVMAVSEAQLGSLVLDIENNVLTGTLLRANGSVGDVFALVKGQGPWIFTDGFEDGDLSAWISGSAP